MHHYLTGRCLKMSRNHLNGVPIDTLVKFPAPEVPGVQKHVDILFSECVGQSPLPVNGPHAGFYNVIPQGGAHGNAWHKHFVRQERIVKLLFDIVLPGKDILYHFVGNAEPLTAFIQRK